MKDKIYILFNERGIKALTKRTNKMKSLPSGTYLAELNLEVNDDFFNNQIPKFNIKLEERQIAELEIEVEKQESSPLSLFFSMIEKEEK